MSVLMNHASTAANSHQHISTRFMSVQLSNSKRLRFAHENQIVIAQ
jgi:hypothetical protein